jgi:type IV pilus assembly protein PilB
VISQLYGTDQAVGQALSELIRDTEETEIEIGQRPAEEELSTAELATQAEEAPVVRIVNMIITQALRLGASDIHIQPEAQRVRIRYRVDGMMTDQMTVPKKVQNSVISRVKIMADMDIAEKRAPQDGRITLRVDRKDFDFRVSTLPNVHGEKVVMRVLDKSSISVGLHKLGLSEGDRERLENMITRPYGILLITGPTGSGKSTTLYALLQRVNTGEKNIITIEDPVEYEVGGLTQAQVNEKAGITFAAGLRTILRQDPDIVMVGEIRDGETAIIATEAALTGHLVLSTLHTNDAPGAVTRMLDMGIEPFLIASSVIGVEAQRLLRLICERCKEAYEPPPAALRRLGLDAEASTKVVFYRGAGCENCRGTGYRGRIGCFELMQVDDSLRDLILQRAPTHELRERALAHGMTLLRDDAIRKVLEGLTTVEEALRVVYVD